MKQISTLAAIALALALVTGCVSVPKRNPLPEHLGLLGLEQAPGSAQRSLDLQDFFQIVLHRSLCHYVSLIILLCRCCSMNLLPLLITLPGKCVKKFHEKPTLGILSM